MTSGMFLNSNMTISVTSLPTSTIYCLVLQQQRLLILAISSENFQMLQMPQLWARCCSTRSWTNTPLDFQQRYLFSLAAMLLILVVQRTLLANNPSIHVSKIIWSSFLSMWSCLSSKGPSVYFSNLDHIWCKFYWCNVPYQLKVSRT